MNKRILFNSIILSAVIFSGIFLFYQSALAGVVQFGDKNIFVDFNGLPFNLSNWAPGISEEKSITIENNESFDINLYFKAKKTSGDDILGNALTVTIENKSSHLSDLFNDNIVLTSVNSGESQNYDIAIKFDEEAGNEYQNKSINFNFAITVEELGEEDGEENGEEDGEEDGEEVIIPGGGGGGYYTPPTTPTTPSTETGEVTATPGEGGITTLTNPDGSKIELTIPPEAVPENTNFTIERVDINSINQPSPESGLFIVNGLVYEIKAEVDGEFITAFDKLLTLSFTYTDEQIEGLNEASLKIYWWNGEDWTVLENSQVNGENNTVVASIDHFSLFALLGSKIGFVEEEKEREEEPGLIISEEEQEIGPGQVIGGQKQEEEVGGEVVEGAVEEAEGEEDLLGASELSEVAEKEGPIFDFGKLLAGVGGLFSSKNLPWLILLFLAIIIILLILRRRKKKE